MPTCCASSCRNRFVKGAGISYYRFPLANKEQSCKWLIAIKRDNFVPTRTSYLCSNHFEEKCKKDRNGKKYLLPNAIPTIFNLPDLRQKKSKELAKLSAEIYHPDIPTTADDNSHTNLTVRMKRPADPDDPTKAKRKQTFEKAMISHNRESTPNIQIDKDHLYANRRKVAKRPAEVSRRVVAKVPKRKRTLQKEVLSRSVSTSKVRSDNGTHSEITTTTTLRLDHTYCSSRYFRKVKKETNIEKRNLEEEAIHANSQTISSETTTNLSKEIQKSVSDRGTSKDAVPKNVSKTIEKPDDEYQLFGDYVASELRSLSSDANRRELKRMIQRSILYMSEKDDNTHTALSISSESSNSLRQIDSRSGKCLISGGSIYTPNVQTIAVDSTHVHSTSAV